MLQICYSGNPAYSWKAAGLSTENSMSIQNLKEQECCPYFHEALEKRYDSYFNLYHCQIQIFAQQAQVFDLNKYFTSRNILHQYIYFFVLT